MPQPTTTVEIAFTTDPTVTPTWTDIQAYVLNWSFHRGRPTERDQVQAGMATVRLDNRDRRFDPNHSGGPYSPNVKVMRRLRIRATWDGSTFDLFHGYVDGWPQSYPGAVDAIVEITATDGFKPLANADLNQTFAQQRSDVRIGAVLDAVGWLAADRNLSTGQQDVAAVTLSGASALNHIQAIAEAENAFLFIAKDGKLTFHDRHRRVKLPITNWITFGDGAGESLYTGLTFAYDDRLLANEVRAARAGGVEQVVSDATSQARYFKRTLTKTGLVCAQDADAYASGTWLLQTYKEPLLRAEPVGLDAEAGPVFLWPHLLNRELGDRFSFRKRPPGGGSMIDQVSHLEAVNYRWTARGGVWAITWTVSPADTTQYWQLDDTSYSVLDSTTRVGY